MLQGGESGLALEVLCTQIYEWGIRLTPEIVQSLEKIQVELGVESHYTQLLRSELMDL